MVEPSDEPFGDALRALLLADGDIYVSAGGNVKWGTFAHVLHGVSYDILRRTVRGERAPSVELMEECARVLQGVADVLRRVPRDRLRAPGRVTSS